MATLAPVDMPVFAVPPCAGAAGAFWAAAALVGSVCASSAAATLRQPPLRRSMTLVTFRTLVAMARAGRTPLAVPLASTRLPTLDAKSLDDAGLLPLTS